MNLNYLHIKNQKGQALVLVLLSLSVVLTLVLFVLARTVTDVSVSSREEEAVRAFSAAEAGIEQALVIGTGSEGATSIGGGDARFSSNVSSFAENLSAFVFPQAFSSGQSATTWFVSHNTDGEISTSCDIDNPCFSGDRIKVCWGNDGTDGNSPTTPAVEVNFVYLATPGDFSTARVARAALDPNTSRSNNFSDPDLGGCVIEGTSFSFQKTLDLSDLGITLAATSGGLQFAKIRMLYNTNEDHEVGIDVGFSGNSTLPSQGIKIDSTGTSGEANRRVEVFQAWPEAPEVFDFSVFSSSGVTK